MSFERLHNEANKENIYDFSHLNKVIFPLMAYFFLE